MTENTLRYLEVFLPTIVPTIAAFLAVYATYWLTKKSERESRKADEREKHEAIREQLRNEMRANQGRIKIWIRSSDQYPDLARPIPEILSSSSLAVLCNVALTPFSFEMWSARLIDLPGVLSDAELLGAWEFYDGLRELSEMVVVLRNAAEQDAAISGGQPMPEPFGRGPNYFPPRGFGQAANAVLRRFNELVPSLLAYPGISGVYERDETR